MQTLESHPADGARGQSLLPLSQLLLGTASPQALTSEAGGAGSRAGLVFTEVDLLHDLAVPPREGFGVFSEVCQNLLQAIDVVGQPLFQITLCTLI